MLLPLLLILLYFCRARERERERIKVDEVFCILDFFCIVRIVNLHRMNKKKKLVAMMLLLLIMVTMVLIPSKRYKISRWWLARSFSCGLQ